MSTRTINTTNNINKIMHIVCKLRIRILFTVSIDVTIINRKYNDGSLNALSKYLFTKSPDDIFFDRLII